MCRTSSWRAAMPLLIVLACWNAYQIARFSEPLKMGHEAWIGRQIGRTARNHLVLGLAITKGANVTTIRDDGSLELHRSYAPLASWAVALPMAAGLPFHAAIRLPVLLSMNLFLASLWAFARGRWGSRVAAGAVTFAALCPVVSVRYGLACIFEILAMGPVMAAVALFAQRSRMARTWLAIVGASIVAAMFSWICWAAIVPCLMREALRGRVRAAILAGLPIVVVPLVVHFGATGLASGDLKGDLLGFAHHVAFRASGGEAKVAEVVTFGMLLEAQRVRWARNMGVCSVAAIAVVLGMALVGRRRVEGWKWLALWLAFALPMNLARNLAYYHDFFIILFVPVAALTAGLAADGVAGRLRSRPLRGLAMGGLVLVMLLLDVLPARKPMRSNARDARQQAIAEGLGAAVLPGDFVVADGELCGIGPEEAQQLGADRECSPRPYYGGMLSQTVHVARDADDAARLAATAPPGRRVVVVAVGDANAPDALRIAVGKNELGRRGGSFFRGRFPVASAPPR